MGEIKKVHNAFLAVEGQIFPLKRETIRIGRHRDNDFIVTESTVSRFHAEIRWEDGKYVIYDLDSTSGVYVNHKKVDRAVLHSGDMLELSNFPMIFVIDISEIKGMSEVDTGKLKKDQEEDTPGTTKQQRIR
jgi:pSer/pThr/pTyr-binding forkhead associated (FHA) protein